MILKSVGLRLTTGTPVYFWDYERSEPIKSFIHPNTSSIHNFYEFTFTPRDELWVTTHVREYWADRPDLHPHATLFDKLWLKLKNHI